MSEIFANQHYFTTEDMEFTVKSVDNLCICWNISHPAYVVAVIMLIIFSVFWIFYMGIKFCNLEFSQGFIFAGLNFKNFFYNPKKQEIKDLQN